MSFPYTLMPEGPAPLGLIVLQVDETIESDFRRLLPVDRPLYVSRIPSGAELTPETIAQMAHDLPRAAALLPQVPDYAAVGYACTSGTTLIGAERVAALVAGECRTDAVCNPLNAAQAAIRALGITRLAVVSPYTAAIADPLCAALGTAGVAVVRALHFGEEIEANVARISPQSVCAASRAAVDGSGAEAVFLSCTNLKTLDLMGPLEAELGVPVFGSNLALAWDMARRAGFTLQAPAPLALLARG